MSVVSENSNPLIPRAGDSQHTISKPNRHHWNCNPPIRLMSSQWRSTRSRPNYAQDSRIQMHVSTIATSAVTATPTIYSDVGQFVIPANPSPPPIGRGNRCKHVGRAVYICRPSDRKRGAWCLSSHFRNATPAGASPAHQSDVNESLLLGPIDIRPMSLSSPVSPSENHRAMIS